MTTSCPVDFTSVKSADVIIIMGRLPILESNITGSDLGGGTNVRPRALFLVG